MKRILVTGSEGQLGKCIKKIGSQYSDMKFTYTDVHKLDVTNVKQVESIFNTENFDICINCAGYTNVELSEIEPKKAFMINAEGVRHLAAACKEHDTTLIHISTDYVFDGKKKEAYTTADKPNPINQYGKSKYRGEEYVQDILHEFYIVRTSWLYSEYGKNFYKTILEKAKTGKKLEVTEEQTGCPTNGDNLARFLLNDIVRGKRPFGIHHFTDGEAMTWYSFAKRILQENGLMDSVQLEKAKNYRTFAVRPKNTVLK